MYYLWMLHYALLKGIYRKRWKEMTSSADSLAFSCVFVLFLFTLVVVVDKGLIWSLIRRRLPLGPMASGFSVFLVPLYAYMLSRKLTPKRVKVIRKVIEVKRTLSYRISLLYVTLYAALFISILFIIAAGRTPYN